VLVNTQPLHCHFTRTSRQPEFQTKMKKCEIPQNPTNQPSPKRVEGQPGWLPRRCLSSSSTGKRRNHAPASLGEPSLGLAVVE
jgi:hypothetical protein